MSKDASSYFNTPAQIVGGSVYCHFLHIQHSVFRRTKLHSFRSKKLISWYTRQENTVKLSSVMSDRKVYCHTSGILKGVTLNTKEITAGTVVVMNVRFNIFFSSLQMMTSLCPRVHI